MAHQISQELTRLLSAIRKLSPQDRRYVARQIREQDGSELSAADLPRHSEDWLLPGLEYELKRRGVMLGPLSAHRLSEFAPNYIRDASQVRAGLKAKLNSQPTQAELLAFGRVCAKALADYKSAEVNAKAFGPKLLLRNVGEIPVALNRSFPGYLASGTLGMILKSVVRGNPPERK